MTLITWTVGAATGCEGLGVNGGNAVRRQIGRLGIRRPIDLRRRVSVVSVVPGPQPVAKAPALPQSRMRRAVLPGRTEAARGRAIPKPGWNDMCRPPPKGRLSPELGASSTPMLVIARRIAAVRIIARPPALEPPHQPLFNANAQDFVNAPLIVVNPGGWEPRVRLHRGG